MTNIILSVLIIGGLLFLLFIGRKEIKKNEEERLDNQTTYKYIEPTGKTTTEGNNIFKIFGIIILVIVIGFIAPTIFMIIVGLGISPFIIPFVSLLLICYVSYSENIGKLTKKILVVPLSVILILEIIPGQFMASLTAKLTYPTYKVIEVNTYHRNVNGGLDFYMGPDDDANIRITDGNNVRDLELERFTLNTWRISSDKLVSGVDVPNGEYYMKIKTTELGDISDIENIDEYVKDSYKLTVYGEDGIIIPFDDGKLYYIDEKLNVYYVNVLIGAYKTENHEIYSLNIDTLEWEKSQTAYYGLNDWYRYQGYEKYEDGKEIENYIERLKQELKKVR